MDPRSHAALRELLPSYAANRLTTSERAAIERHIATCAECRAEAREWLTLGEWLAQVDAAIPPDTGAAQGLAALHARLRQSPAHRATAHDLHDLHDLHDFDGFERSALSHMSNHNAPRYSNDSGDTQPAASRYERRLPTGPSYSAPERTYRSQPPQRRIPPVAAGATVVVFLALVASLFYLLAPQIRNHQIGGATATPTARATATTQATATPAPLAGSWHTAPNLPGPLYDIVFAKSAPQTGYLCTNTSPVPASSSKWLYKSGDGGMTWRPVGGIATPSVSKPVLMNCAVFVDSNDANDVFAQLLLESTTPGSPSVPVSGTLWRSRDGGATWTQLTMPRLFQGWHSLVVVGSRLVGLGTDANQSGPICTTDPSAIGPHQVNDLYASDDGGKTWTQIGQPLISQGLSITPVGSGGNMGIQSVGTTLFVWTFCMAKQGGGYSTSQIYWASTDGGRTWKKLPTPDSVIASLAFTPSASGSAYGVALNLGADATPPALPVALYSRDSGATWKALPSLGFLLGSHTAAHISVGWIIALPDGSVLAAVDVVDNAGSPSGPISSGVYAIDPQSSNPTWRQFAPASAGSLGAAAPAGWPLATTNRGSVLWALASDARQNPQGVYLSPLP